MYAVLLVGHGSLRSASGAAMIRLAAHARAAGIAPIIEAGFLNYSRPTFMEALDRCVAQGATEVAIQPYFLIPGKFVREDMPPLLTSGRAAYPQTHFVLTRPFGDHEALAQLVQKRVATADRSALPCADDLRETGLVILAHGSPDPGANQPIHAVAERIRQAGCYAAVVVCFLGLNPPRIADAIDDLVARGLRQIVAVPYFLQLGGHVAEDLPTVIDAARARHPVTRIILTEHLAYDRLLLAVIADRVDEALSPVLLP